MFADRRTEAGGRVARRHPPLRGTVALAAALLAAACAGPRLPFLSRTPELVVAINRAEEGEALAELARGYGRAHITPVELPYSLLEERLSDTFATGSSTFDLVMLDDPWFPALAPYLAPLDDLPGNLVADLLPSCLRLGRDPYPNGRIRALPWVGNTLLLLYRKDLLHAAGYDEPPATWSGLAEAAEAVASSSPGVAGYCGMGGLDTVTVTGFLPILWGEGGELFADRGVCRTVVLAAPDHAEATVRAFALYARLAALAPRGSDRYDRVETTASLIAGASAMELSWPAVVPVVDRLLPRNPDGTRRWGIAVPPGDGRHRVSVAGNWLLGVPLASEHQREARDFLVWLLENQEAAARRGNPPTRASVYDALAGDPSYAYLATVRQALEVSEPRARSLRWEELERAVAAELRRVADGELAPAAAGPEVAEKLEAIVERPSPDRRDGPHRPPPPPPPDLGSRPGPPAAAGARGRRRPPP